ncbi:MAG: YcaO-like family protein [Bacteriovoracia bacterium]
MSLSIIEIIRSVLVSQKLTEFFKGVQFTFPGLSPLTFKITASSPAKRMQGYRFNRHSIMTKIEAEGEVVASGYGESDFELLALQKSISEAVERCVFKLAKKLNPDLRSSSGWAAHLTPQKARAAAQTELLERDSILLHWLSQTPFLEIAAHTLPKDLIEWASKELSLAPRFNQLRILTSTLGTAPSVVTILQDKDGFAFSSQASSSSLRGAIERALAEVCRIADFAEQGFISPPDLDKPSSPEGHSVYYAYHSKLPTWLFGNSILFSAASRNWNERSRALKNKLPKSSFSDFQFGPLFVAHCASKEVQDLFFGSAEAAASRGWINFEHLEKVCGGRALCSLPHFVP